MVLGTIKKLIKKAYKTIKEDELEKKEKEVEKKLEKLVKEFFEYIGYSSKEAEKLAKNFIEKHRDRIRANLKKLMDIL